MAPATLTHSILVVDDDPDIALGFARFARSRRVPGERRHDLCGRAGTNRCPSVQRRTAGPGVARRRRLLGPAHVTRTTTAASRHHFDRVYQHRPHGRLADPGAFAYLTTKPYNRDELRAVLQRAVGVHALAAKVEHAEHALHESEARFQSLVEAATDSIVLADHQGHILSWNRAAAHLFGYTDDEVRGQSLSMLMPAWYRAATSVAWRGSERRDKPVSSGVSSNWKDYARTGSFRSSFRWPCGTRTRPSSTAVSFVTLPNAVGRKTFLDRLRHLHEVILTQAGEGIYGLDEAGRTTFINPTAAQLLGY